MRTRVSHRSTCRTAGLALVGALAIASGAAGCSPPRPAQIPGEATVDASPPLSDRERAIHLLNRATYGARARDVEAVLSAGIEAWLDRQLRPASIDNGEAEALVARLTQGASHLFSGHGVFPPVPSPQQRAAGQQSDAGASPDLEPSLRERADMRHAEADRLLDAATRLEILAAWLPRPLSTRLRRRAKPLHAQAQRELFEAMQLDTRANVEEALLRQPPRTPESFAAARLARAVYSRRQLEEVMTDFWFNHFNVFLFKDDVALALDDYEQRAIRAHVFGRFEDMLVATARHPAMLRYLDASPVRPPGDGRAPSTIDLLNENYARELLELHTLGVDGGYTQADIVAIARAFTGWTVVERRMPATAGIESIQRERRSHTPELIFEFEIRKHDRSPKIVLGRTLPAGRGIQDGIEVLRVLARHPSTARHLARKLVRHFVADDPPPALVAAIADVYRRTDGDLRAVTRALFTADAFYHPVHVRAKAKRPFEFVASALRMSGAVVRQAGALVMQLRLFGHLPYAEPIPTGYPATRDAWISGGALVARMQFGIALADGDVYGVRIPLPELPEQIDWRDDAGARTTVIRAVLQRLLPGAPPADLEDALHLAAGEWTGMDAAAAASALTGVALASPAFQWH